MSAMLAEFRYAFRSLARQPTFTAVAILTLVLGIGTNTAIFSVIKAVLLNQLPYQDASRLVVLSEQNPDGTRDLVAPLTYVDWKDQTRSIESLAAFRQLRYAFAGAQRAARRAERARHAESVHGPSRERDPRAGRFCPKKAQPGADRVAVLSRAVLAAPFRRISERDRPDDSARRAALHGHGRHAGELRFPAGRIDRRLDAAQFRSEGRARPLAKARSLNVVGRLANGVGHEQAQREMTVVASRLASTYPDSNAGWGARVTSAQEQLVTTVRPALLHDLGRRRIPAAHRLRECREPCSCAPVQPAGRDRVARGARRRTLAGSRARSWPKAWSLPPPAARWACSSRGPASASSTRCPLAACRGWTTCGSTAACCSSRSASPRWSRSSSAWCPALQAARSGLRDTMNAFSASTRQSGTRLLSALVVVEVALALTLLVGAGLMMRSFAQLMRVSPGFEPRNLLAVQIYLPQAKYKTGLDRSRFYMESLRRISVLPGVQSAAAVSALPMYPVGIDFALPFTIEGKPAPPTARSRAPTSASRRRDTSRR